TSGPDFAILNKGYTSDGKRHAVTLRTSDEGIAVTRAQAILAEGLLATEAYTPNEPALRKREIHGLVDLYLKDAQNRHKKALRVGTANTRRYVLNKFITDCSSVSGPTSSGVRSLPAYITCVARSLQIGLPTGSLSTRSRLP